MTAKLPVASASFVTASRPASLLAFFSLAFMDAICWYWSEGCWYLDVQSTNPHASPIFLILLRMTARFLFVAERCVRNLSSPAVLNSA